MKVLLITYYWPPAGGPGVQRWLKFVKYFKEFGIEPIVYCPENPTYPMLDTSLATEIPAGTTVLQRPIVEPYRWASLFSKKETKTISKGLIAAQQQQSLVQRILLYIRGNFFIPDARKYWVRPSIMYLKKYIDDHGIDTIITTGPPHSIHLIGKGLKEAIGVRWIADFRDPWTTIGYHTQLKLTEASMRKHQQLEKEVLTTADQLVVTSYTTQQEFKAITERPITVITNGYDQEAVGAVAVDTKFTVAHIGSLLSGRNPMQLWEVFYELTQSNAAFAAAFELQLVGAVSEEVLQSIDVAGLSDFVNVRGYVPHQEAIEIQRSAQVLLLIEIDSPDTRCIIPGKLFEYMIAKRPILAVGPSGADIAQLLDRTETGVFMTYDAKEAMKTTLLSYFDAYTRGNLVVTPKGIERYSRRSLTEQMAALLKAPSPSKTNQSVSDVS